jgi:hypothetical protein
MPWSLSNLPPALKNKTEEQKKIFIRVANEALKNGRTDQEAIFAGLAATNNLGTRKKAVEKVVKVTPSHVPKKVQEDLVDTSKAVLEASFGREVLTDALGNTYSKNVLPIRREFLGDEALPTDTDRNLVYADFNDNNELVLRFDTGEEIVTKSIAVEQIYEQFVSIYNQQQQDAGPVQPSNIKHYDQMLTGTLVVIGDGTHKIHEIVSIYFTKNGRDVSVDWEFDSNKNIIIRSNVDLTGVLLVAHGK